MSDSELDSSSPVSPSTLLDSSLSFTSNASSSLSSLTEFPDSSSDSFSSCQSSIIPSVFISSANNTSDTSNSSLDESVRARRHKRTYLISSSSSDSDKNSSIPSSLTKRLKTNNSDLTKAGKSLEHSDLEVDVSCSICLDSVKEIKLNKKKVMSTICGHILCSECTKAIFNQKSSIECPKCRAILSNSQVHPLFI